MRDIPDGKLNTALGYLGVPGKGSYGGDQGGPLAEWLRGGVQQKEILRKIVKKNRRFAELTDDQIRILLTRLKSEGCGYTALMNTVFLQFWNAPVEYEKIFGFPMFRDGKPLFAYLILDFYAATDNMYYADDGDFEFKYEDYNPKKDGPIFEYNPRMDETGNGTEQYQRKTRFTHYMREHGILPKFETRGFLSLFGKRLRPEKCLKHMGCGQYVIITVKAPKKGIWLRNAGDGQVLLKGEHVMLLTGISDDEKVFVSSWGRKYMLEYKEIVNRSYVEYITYE